MSPFHALTAIESTYPYVDVVPGGTHGFINGSSYNFSHADVTDQPGVAGQNNSNPASIFPNHAVVAYVNSSNQTVWYDPSYGGLPCSGDSNDARLLNFQMRSIAGFLVEADNVSVNQSTLSGADSGTGQVIRTVFFLKPNDGTLRLTCTYSAS
jgi:hypothetical protein